MGCVLAFLELIKLSPLAQSHDIESLDNGSDLEQGHVLEGRFFELICVNDIWLLVYGVVE